MKKVFVKFERLSGDLRKALNKTFPLGFDGEIKTISIPTKGDVKTVSFVYEDAEYLVDLTSYVLSNHANVKGFDDEDDDNSGDDVEEADGDHDVEDVSGGSSDDEDDD